MSPDLSPVPPAQSSARTKQKPFTIGITAGAEDVKYQAKYKDMKRKVKDIETVGYPDPSLWLSSWFGAGK